MLYGTTCCGISYNNIDGAGQNALSAPEKVSHASLETQTVLLFLARTLTEVYGGKSEICHAIVDTREGPQ